MYGGGGEWGGWGGGGGINIGGEGDKKFKNSINIKKIIFIIIKLMNDDSE
jgi:hypothetical protein